MSSSIREQIEAIDADAANQKQEFEKQKKEAEAERRNAKRRVRQDREQGLAERQRDWQQQEDERGYDYPNLRKYQLSIERTANVGAALLCILAAVFLIVGLARATTSKSETIEVVGSALSVVTCLVSAAAWYYWWMIVAEMIRLTITVALDVRSIRDANRGEEG